MNAQHQPAAVVERLLHNFSDWLRQRRELRELNQLDGADFDRIASELQVAPLELERLVHQGPHAADELPRLLKALGIDEAALARAEPLVLRDMGRVCALCQEKGQCLRDLAAGTSPAHYAQYCLNASTIRALDQPGSD
jgi:transcriptional regulator with XRE-family HTH domain